MARLLSQRATISEQASQSELDAFTGSANIATVGTVTSGTISTGTVMDDPTMTQGSDATGDVYYRAAGGALTRLATGADGTVLTSTGAGAVPAFEAVPSFNADAAQVFNESGADVDFRVEGSGQAYALFVQGSDGFVGIGTGGTMDASGAPSTLLHLRGNAVAPVLLLQQIANSAGDFGANDKMGEIRFGGHEQHDETEEACKIGAYAEAAWTAGSQSSYLRFDTRSAETTSEKMRITSGGEVKIVKTLKFGSGYGYSSTLKEYGTIDCVRSGEPAGEFQRNDGTGEVVRIKDDGVNIGSIDTNGSNASYNTSSDYRLKENVIAMIDAINRLKNLKPSRFNFIENPDVTMDGFIAHEVQEVIPEAVNKEKDQMKAEVLYTEDDELPEGKSIGDVKEAEAIDPQGVDYAKITPLLVGALQEAIARIEVLESA